MADPKISIFSYYRPRLNVWAKNNRHDLRFHQSLIENHGTSSWHWSRKGCGPENFFQPVKQSLTIHSVLDTLSASQAKSHNTLSPEHSFSQSSSLTTHSVQSTLSASHAKSDHPLSPAADKWPQASIVDTHEVNRDRNLVLQISFYRKWRRGNNWWAHPDEC